jgi:hypothetical protein
MAERSIAIRIAIRDAEQAARILKSLGADGEAAWSRIAEGAPRASRALEEVGQAADRSARQISAKFQNAGFQVQDFFVQIQSGTPVLTATIQQGSQLASAFGPVGVALGLVGVVAGVAAGALFNMGGNAEDAAKEADNLAKANASVAEALRLTGNDADTLAAKFDRLNEAQKQFAVFGLEEEIRKRREGLKQLREEAENVTAGLEFSRVQISAASDPRFQGPEADRARRFADLNRQALAAREAFAGGGSLTEFVTTLNKLGDSDAGLKRIAQGLLETGQKAISAEQAIGELDARLAAYQKRATTEQKQTVSGKDPIDTARREAEKLAERTRRESDSAAKKALRDAKRLADEQEKLAESKREFVAGIEFEREAALALQAAQAKGEDAYQSEKRAIEANNVVRSKKLKITEEEYDSLVNQIEATKEITAETERRRRVEQEAEKDRQKEQDSFFERADKDIEKEDQELKRQAERQADIISDIFAQPFKDIASEVSNLTGDMIAQLAGVGTEGGKSFAQNFQEATQNLSKNLLGSIASAPINIAIGGLNAALGEAAKGDGGIGAQIGALGKWATANPLNAGIAGGAGGALVGTAYGQIAGKPNSYASAGGAVGGAAGAALGTYLMPGVGTYVGGALGSLAGSVFGGMFGGGDDNSGDNNMRQRFAPGRGVYYRESPQEGGEQNTQAVNQFMDQLMKAGKVFESAGLLINENFGPGIDLKVGSNSGITLDGKKYTSIEDALGAAIQQLGKRGYRAEGESVTEQVARNTKATTAEGLAADFAFAKEYPKLISRMGETGRAIDAIAEQFEALKDKAAELGLSVTKLDAVQDEQIHAIKEEARLRIAILTGEASEYRQALLNLSATFEKAKQDAKDLGISTEELNKARDRERSRLENEAETSIRKLTGDYGSLDEAMRNLNTTYEQAKRVANDLGISTEKLNAVRDAERERLRAGANADLRVLMGEWDPLAQQIIQLRDVFNAANENAKDLGYTEERLMAARKRATEELIENRRAEVREALQSQADQLRGFFSSILDPLRQAQSAFGGLQGIASPQASLSAGLTEFRELAARARNDDLGAIQALPGQGQQLLQLARQYGASGAPFADIMREVNAVYAEVEKLYRDRQMEALGSIGDAVIRTGADNIKTLTDGFTRLQRQLEAVEKAIRASSGRIAA